MSMDRTTYVIAGYDLTGYITEKFKDWKWSDEGESLICNQIKSNIQLFDDPMSGQYVYLGYVFARLEEYGYDTEMISPEKISEVMPGVNQKLLELESKGIISSCPRLRLDYKLIVFDEWS